MAKRPRILVAGILDTKGAEIRFLADRVRAAGGDPTIMELTVGGGEVGWADIGVSELTRPGRHVRRRTLPALAAIGGGRSRRRMAPGRSRWSGSRPASSTAMIGFGGSMGSEHRGRASCRPCRSACPSSSSRR